MKKQIFNYIIFAEGQLRKFLRPENSIIFQEIFDN